MAYIAPNTTIELYKRVPLDKTYRHTVKYATANDQYNDFQQYRYKAYEKQSYQRWGQGTIKIEETVENLFGVNYMIFYNDMGGLVKKVYAFVTGYDYISNRVSQVYYQIDVLQTYMFDYNFRKSFVERNHTYSDIQGTEIEPEGLELGDMYTNDGWSGYAGIGGAWHYIILATAYPSGQPFDAPKLINGIFSGLYYYDTTSADNVATLIQTYIDQGLEDSIVSFYMGPPNTGDGDTVTQKIQVNKINGYTPRNKKLLTYPYRYIQVSNNLGVTIDLKLDYMNGPNKDDNGTYWNFQYYITYLNFPQPIMIFHPYYAGYGNTSNQDYELQYSVFPSCAFSGDSFKVWWAQNKNSYLASLNSIQNTYDTNIALARNAYQQAYNSALAEKQSTLNSINNGLTNAENQRDTSKTMAQNTYDTATQNIGSSISQSVSNGASNLLDWFRSTGGGNDASGHLTQRKTSEAMSNSSTMLTNTLNQSNVSAQTILNNANLSADLSYDIASAVASTNTENAERSYSTALKNATLSQEAAELSALSTADIATYSLNAKKQDAMHQPSTVHGQSACDGANVYMYRVGFNFQLKSINATYAQKIDQYFDLYGYAVRRLEVPSVDNRKHYTYLKTTACEIYPSSSTGLDGATKSIIEGIYNNGITTWKKLSEVANYDLASDNTPYGSQY